MQIYKVGGAVRDTVMRLNGQLVTTADVDWVVVGATPEMMIRNGFKPVGNDFPVFLHPENHEEYALARTERKTALGYHGFDFYTAPNVTIEEDLRRRDLTINAMAQAQDGTIIDPYGGQSDIQNRILRHVSPAFAEDPVRILRIARFSARFPSFSIAPETQDLLHYMVNKGETDSLVAERIWAEISKGLMETKPSQMIRVLTECGYWKRSWSSIVIDDDLLSTLDSAANRGEPLVIRAALLLSNINHLETLKSILSSLRIPSAIGDLCTLVIKNRLRLLKAQSVEDFFAILESSDILRRPERFKNFLLLLELKDNFSTVKARGYARCYVNVDVKSVATCNQGKNIRFAIEQARLAALREKESLSNDTF